MKVKVTLFKASGKYYTEEEWVVPSGAIGPFDMEKSCDFRRIDGGAVLIQSQEPWGYPHLFPGREVFPDVPNPVTLDERLTKVERRLQGIIEQHSLWDGS